MKEFIFIDGEPFKEKIPLRSICYGEGVFESFRWKMRPPVFWDKHLERMKKGAKLLGIPFPGVGDIEWVVERAILDSQISDAYVKICLLSKGNSNFYETPTGYALLGIVREFQPPKELITACISSFSRNSSSPILRIKSLNYIENILAKREAMESGFDEAIFLNERGEITEGSVSNTFWLREGVLYTPSLECGLLPGVIRDVTIEAATEVGIQVSQGSFDPGVFIVSQGVFLTNSLMGVGSVSQINGHKLPTHDQAAGVLKSAILEKLNWF
jgi:4-amino-4-deoxychorismate lyase